MELRRAIARVGALTCLVGEGVWAQSPDRDGIARYASCRRLGTVPAYVEVDPARRIHVCARVTTNNIGPYLATAAIRYVADTVFISPVVELPRGESLLMTEVSWVAYQVFLGPYPSGARVRVTTRGSESARSKAASLDTLVRIP